MRAVIAGALLGLLASSPSLRVDVEAAAACPVSNAVLGSGSYLSCKSATGAILSEKAASVSVDASSFCGNSNCYAVWSEMAQQNLLRCYQQYSVGGYDLKQRTSGANCFADKGGSAAPTSAPAPSTPQPTSESPAAPAPTTRTTTTTPTAPTAPATRATPGATTTPTGDTGGAGTATNPSSPASPTSPGGTTTDTTTTTTPSNKIPSTGSASTDTKTDENTTAGGGNGENSDSTNNKPATTSGQGGEEDGENGTQKEKEQGADGETETSTKKTPSSTSTSAESATTGGTSKSNGTSDQPGGSPNKGDDGDTIGESSSTVWVASGTSTGGVVLVAFLFVYIRRRKDVAIAANKLDAPVGDDAGYLPTLHSSRSQSSSNDSFIVMGDTRYDGFTVQSSKFAFGEDEVIAAARIPFEKLKRGVLISRGGYGEVYRGSYRDEVVAIKTLLPGRRNDMRQIENFLAEVKLMASLEHDHIVRFIGVAWDSLNELCVVSEFVERGDLRALLYEYSLNPGAPAKGFNPDKIKIALHVAHALTYMHSLQPMVLHRDLKSRNILLNDKLDAKVTDFGVSRERADSTMTMGVGSSLWMAPEVMTGGRYDEKADVFSFGVVLSELDTHTLPYAHALEPGTKRKLPDTVVVQMMTTGRLSVEFTDEDNCLMAQLGRECVALDPRQRPSAAELQHLIHQMARTGFDSR